MASKISKELAKCTIQYCKKEDEALNQLKKSGANYDKIMTSNERKSLHSCKSDKCQKILKKSQEEYAESAKSFCKDKQKKDFMNTYNKVMKKYNISAEDTMIIESKFMKCVFGNVLKKV
jgi:hypothetical protein